MIEAWAPTVIALLALGFVSVGVRKGNEKISERVDKIENECLGKDKHTLLCENASLKINAHISEEMTKLKDVIFKELREIKEKVE